MIRYAITGMARIVFNAASILIGAGCLLVYISYRLARASVAKDRGQPVREAGFTVLVALVALGKALQAQGAKAQAAPGPAEPPAPDVPAGGWRDSRLGEVLIPW